jgi:hypothetical protein
MKERGWQAGRPPGRAAPSSSASGDLLRVHDGGDGGVRELVRVLDDGVRELVGVCGMLACGRGVRVRPASVRGSRSATELTIDSDEEEPVFEV